MDERANMTWQRSDSREIYRNPWIAVREDEVTRPDGTPGVYGVVTLHHPAAFVVPVTAANEVIMISQRRYTTGEDSLEVPAGGTDGEPPLIAAQRELREETGLTAATWRDLGPVYSLNGIAHAPGQVFLATDLTEEGGAEQQAEGITALHHIPLRDLPALIAENKITDNESLAALLLALTALGRIATD